MGSRHYPGWRFAKADIRALEGHYQVAGLFCKAEGGIEFGSEPNDLLVLNCGYRIQGVRGTCGRFTHGQEGALQSSNLLNRDFEVRVLAHVFSHCKGSLN